MQNNTAVNCMRHYNAALVALHAREEGAIAGTARTRAWPMVFDGCYKLNTAQEVEARADKRKVLDYTFTACRRLPT